jgi:hypothetical protein
MKVLACDPGIRGGPAIVMVNDGAVPTLVDAIDIPVAGLIALTPLPGVLPKAVLVETAEPIVRTPSSNSPKNKRRRRSRRAGARLKSGMQQRPKRRSPNAMICFACGSGGT